MSLLAIVFFVLALAMMLGPVLLLQPSQRQQRIASLRREAALRGLRVRILTDKGNVLTVYEHPWQTTKQKQIKVWGLKRKPYEHGLHLAKFWQWLDQNRPTNATLQQLSELLPQLPAGVDCIVAEQAGVYCGWAENGGVAELESINQVLVKLTEGDHC